MLPPCCPCDAARGCGELTHAADSQTQPPFFDVHAAVLRAPSRGGSTGDRRSKWFAWGPRRACHRPGNLHTDDAAASLRRSDWDTSCASREPRAEAAAQTSNWIALIRSIASKPLRSIASAAGSIMAVVMRVAHRHWWASRSVVSITFISGTAVSSRGQ